MKNISPWRKDKVRRIVRHRNGTKSAYFEKGDYGLIPESIQNSVEVGTLLEYRKSILNKELLIDKSMRKGVKALAKFNLEQILFFDIETVRQEKSLMKKNTALWDAWKYKKKKDNYTDAELKKSYTSESPLFAEFGKVVCISLGYSKEGELRTRDIIGDEKELLQEFSEMLYKFPNFKLCGISIIGFDIPYLAKRYIVNGEEIPRQLDLSGEKPWTVTDNVIDLSNIWKSTGFYGAPLSSICYALGVDSPKNIINGADVSKEYYSGNIKGIKEYCNRDIVATYEIYKKMTLSDEINI